MSATVGSMTLRDLGFTAFEEAVYRALLADPARDPGSFGEPTEADVRAALGRLAELGVVAPDEETACGFAVLDPGVAVGALIERIEDETLRRHRRVADTRAQLAELAAPEPDRSTGADTGVEVVDTVEQVRQRLDELSFFTRTSVYTVQPAGSPDPAARAAARPLEQRGLRRGIDTRIIYDRSVLANATNCVHLRHRVAAGVGIRLLPGPVQRLIIMDEQVAIVPVGPDSRGALVVRQPGLLRALTQLFHVLWSAAEELEPTDARLTEQDRSVLAMLAAGSTDEIAARELGLSVRHLRRRIAVLMDRLHAHSRFEAGAAAARRGWI
ncbi:MAG TPA: LuxR C-terminal-related transcriptional regulator [Pseudonocardiaceae bacterium]|nr:LuxR C-terminal-related transcriptional regulator [Pseudonocardiaceae bacterium]